jgi:hypothetical protein
LKGDQEFIKRQYRILDDEPCLCGETRVGGRCTDPLCVASTALPDFDVLCNELLCSALSPRRSAKLVERISVGPYPMGPDNYSKTEIGFSFVRTAKSGETPYDQALPTGEVFRIDFDTMDRLCFAWLRERNLLGPEGYEDVATRAIAADLRLSGGAPR